MIAHIKLIAAILVIVGIVIGFISLKYSPHGLLLESSPKRPAWLPWVGWALTSSAAVLYIVADYIG